MALPVHEAYRRDIAGRESGIPDLLPDYLNRIGREKLLDRVQEIRLNRQAKNDDRRARNTLVEKRELAQSLPPTSGANPTRERPHGGSAGAPRRCVSRSAACRTP